MRLLSRIFPFVGWFRDINPASLRADLVAGVTVALVLIPQSMAYAQLASLPAYYGLYAAFLPPMVASLFGSSRQLATGPVAVVSLMTAAALEPIATAGSQEFIIYAILLAFLVGAFQFLLGLFRLGLVVNFLSHPVVNGFTCAAALIIATSQLPKIFGVTVDKADHHYETVARTVLAAFQYTHWPTLSMAALAFAVMIGLKKVNPKIPNVLVAVVLTTLLSALLGFHRDIVVPLDRIRSPEASEAIAAFNTAVEDRQRASELRTATGRKFSDMAGRDQSFCGRCHEDREITGFLARARDKSVQADAAAIHQMAGLLDGYIDSAKRKASRVRSVLREYSFEGVRDPEGHVDLYLRGQVPPGSKGDGRRWRLKVGEDPLDGKGLSLSGGGAVVGVIPRGLPEIKAPPVRQYLSVIPGLIPAAIIISLLGFMEAISIAKAMAAKTRQKLDPNQELMGQGLANLLGCCGQSYPCSGSFSRSAVNLQAGARTGLSNVFSGLAVVVVLLFLTPLLYHLPQAVLAAIIMMAVVGLLNVRGFVHAWQVRRFDGITGVLSFVATLGFAPHLEWGIFIGVGLSLGGYLYRTMRPKVVALSPHSDGAMRDTRRYGLKQCRYIATIRFDGPLNFASVSYMEDEVLGRVATMAELRHVLIDGMGINEIDASGEEMLRHLVERLRGVGYQVWFSGMKDEVMDAIRRAHLHEFIGEHRFFPTLPRAVASIYVEAHAENPETDCPFRSLMPRTTELSLHPDGSLRDARRRSLSLCRRIAIFRFDDPLTYANTSFLEEEILKLVSDRPRLRHVLFSALGITEIDPAGAEKIGALVERLRKDGYGISFSSFKDNVLDLLERSGVLDKIGREHVYPTQAVAVAGIWARAHAGSVEDDCPLVPLLPRLAELSLHSDGSHRDAHRHRLRLCERIVAIRFDGALNRGAMDYFEHRLLECIEHRPGARHVMVAAHGINDIDPECAVKLAALVERLRRQEYRICFSGLKDEVLDVLRQKGAYETLGEKNMYPTQVAAIEAIHARAHADGAEEKCPLREVVRRDS